MGQVDSSVSGRDIKVVGLHLDAKLFAVDKLIVGGDRLFYKGPFSDKSKTGCFRLPSYLKDYENS